MAITLLPQPKTRLIHRPYMVLAWLQVADVFTTGLVLAYWAMRAEGNPIARFFTDNGTAGLAVLLILKLAMVWLLWWCQTRVRLASAVYGLVVANNVLFLALWFAR